MNYSEKSLSFKIKKVLRYAMMYGIRRTYIKVMGQLHMKRTFEQLPPQRAIEGDRQIVGIIGCGNYSFSNIAYFLDSTFGRVIGSCMDVDINRAASMATFFKIPRFSDDAATVINDENIKLIYIASNHSTHAEYAIQALNRGKHVYIEKPHVVSVDQLERLVAAMAKSTGKVFLGFNRPGSRFGRLMAQYLAAESGSGMYNWFVAGHDIPPDHWYFNPQEGGRVLGNLCHWTDFLLRIVPKNAFPITITPARGKTSDSNIAVSFKFGDDTIAVITFSAKGHTFEGVKERFTAHKGNCLLSMDDFWNLTVEIVNEKHVFRNQRRDHGHKSNIVAAVDAIRRDLPYDRQERIDYIANTAWLFLKTKEALELDQSITIQSFTETFRSDRGPVVSNV